MDVLCIRSGRTSDAAVLVYMDVDLSTDLAALAPLVAPLISGHSDLAIGTRLGRGARVVRGPKREIISRCYNLILKSTLAAGFSDAQCGFKAIRADVAARLLPLVEDTGWFFDTELLVLAERSGLRIHEVPVDWVDDPDSRVDIVATAAADLKGIGRLLRGLATGAIPVNTIAAQLGSSRHAAAPRSLLRQVVRFGAVGLASTAAYVLLFVALQGWAGAQLANLIALLVTAIANTAANRRFTFGIGGSRSWPVTTSRVSSFSASRWPSPAARSAVLHATAPATHHMVELGRAGAWPTCRHHRSIRACCAAGCSTPRDARLKEAIDDTATDAPLRAITEPAPAPTIGRNRAGRWHSAMAPSRAGCGPRLLALLAATAVLYLWGLGSSGWANQFYAAAAQAGTQDWKAWLFGSLDAGNAITVDKPPAALWVMALSGRLFGFTACSPCCCRRR